MPTSLLKVLCACLVAASAAEALAQPPPAPPSQAVRLRVYLDCGNTCFEEYLRDEIRFVDFVRQPQDADVHLLASSRETGGGGREVVLRFTAVDPVIESASVASATFRVDNNEEPIATLDDGLLYISPDLRNGIAIPYTVFD